MPHHGFHEFLFYSLQDVHSPIACSKRMIDMVIVDIQNVICKTQVIFYIQTEQK